MSEKIKEIDFEELWNRVREMREKAVLADEACTLLSKLYKDDVEFTVEDDYGRIYDGDVDSVILRILHMTKRLRQGINVCLIF